MGEKTTLSREQQAAIELGHTRITRAQAWAIVLPLLSILLAVPVVQAVHEVQAWRAGQRPDPWPACWRIVEDVASSLKLAWGIDEPASSAVGAAPAASTPLDRVMHANRALLASIRDYEQGLTDQSLLTELLVPPVQQVLASRLGAGNERAYVGADGWLFYRPDVDSVVGAGFLNADQLARRAQGGGAWQAAPQPDPVLAILEFNRQLARRGIRLIVVPTPVKPTVQAEGLDGRADHLTSPQNASFDTFLAELAKPERFLNRSERLLGRFANVPAHKASRSWYWPMLAALRQLQAQRQELLAQPVLVCDPTAILGRLKEETGQNQYLWTDTHWRPEAVQAVARELGTLVEQQVELSPAQPGYAQATMAEVVGAGDIARMMRLPAGQTIYPPQRVAIRQVVRGNTLWQADPKAEILLLGDSFSSIYSMEAMGWGEGAGLAEQLSLTLQRPVDALLRNDHGAFSTREMLSRALARGQDRLAGKRVVIWQFAARELTDGDWRVDLPMTLGPQRPGDFLAVGEGQDLIVRGTVEAITPAPRPGSVPYADHIVYMHLTDLRSHDGGPLPASDALVAMFSMRDHVWTGAARYRVGQEVTLRLGNYDQANRQLQIDSINSTMLDGDIALESPCWGQEPDSAKGADEGAPAPRAQANMAAGWAGRSWQAEAMGAMISVLICAVILRLAEWRQDQPSGRL
jgi:alginate O-acetyltransferase complex protein AlgJ